MRFVFFVIVCFSIISCKKESSKFKNEPFIISKKWKEYINYVSNPQKDKNGNILPPSPPKLKYGYGLQNFIIDDSSNLYYYQFRPQSMEHCIWAEDDTIPYFQDLKAEMLIQIPISSIDDFVKLNFKKGFSNKVKIVSQKDTLNSKTYFDLINALDKRLDYENDRDVFAIFPSTQEEDTVLYYMKHKKYYFSNQIKWDLKKIKFFPKPKINQ